MSGGMVSRSGAKPSAGRSAPPTPLRPSTKGSSITFKNWLVSWNLAYYAAVAGSPESWSVKHQPPNMREVPILSVLLTFHPPTLGRDIVLHGLPIVSGVSA